MLEKNHEVLGVVRDVIVGEDEIKIIFAMDREIEVPKSAFSHDELQKFIDEKIGIIRIGDTYRLRRI